MKKWLWLLLVIPSPALAFTDSQLNQAKMYTQQIDQTCVQLLTLLQAVQLAQDNGFTVSGSTNTVSISAQQQADVTTYYQSLKTQMANEYNALP